ncbi:MAG: sulfite oxidase [Deinococcota bacterium]|jgi:DMSO/TMAO reductase YedYZ molybdopterin-dependent catalytic subunit|nr:sulfite oxidase [Deinococcota bacterium]
MRSIKQDDAHTTEPGLIIREKDPENLEFPFSSLKGLITPSERFYVRSHFPVPKLDLATWRLSVEGAVEAPCELSYNDLVEMQDRTRPALLECAGNNRVFLESRASGVQWEQGAVGNAEWTGVPLAELLERAGLREGATEVVLEGADQGVPSEEPRPAGEIRYARSLPLDKALRDVLLAYRMNGETLPASHGFPLRAVVPGWYGMASVKWLSRILVTDRPFRGYFQTVDYAYWERQDGLPVRAPITETRVKAQIARPSMLEVVPRATDYRVFGAAWTGESEVVKVELSTDGGESFTEVALLGEALSHTWRLWEYVWRTPGEPGRTTLMVRATDARGHRQPQERDGDRGSYMINHVLPIDVQVH